MTYFNFHRFLLLLLFASCFFALGEKRVFAQINHAPNPTYDYIVFDAEDESITFDVLANDWDADGDELFITDFNWPANGWLEQVADGSGVFTYTLAFPMQFDFFSYTVCDDGWPQKCSQSGVFIEINCEVPTEEVDCGEEHNGGSSDENEFDNEWGEDCDCEDNFEPVCTDEGDMYYNACFADCIGIYDYLPCDLEEPEDESIGIINFADCDCDFELWDPVCFNGEDGMEDEFLLPNACIAECLGFTNFVSCEWEEEEEIVLECTNDCVWPGDVNQDGIANHFDILGLGLAFGQTGPERPDATTEWMPQYAEDWLSTILGTVNSNHADCDGNGWVDEADVAVINDNYLLANTNWNFDVDATTSVPFYLAEAEDGTTSGTIEIPIILGEDGNEAFDFYGIAFTIEYDNEYIEAGSVALAFENSWIGTSEDFIVVVQDFPEVGIVEVGISLINNEPTTGYGEIATLSVVMEDNLAGKDLTDVIDIDFSLKAICNMGTVGHVTPTSIAPISQSVEVALTKEPVINNRIFPSQEKIYPNPCTTQVKLAFTEAQITNDFEISIQNLLGQTLIQKTYHADTPEATINTSNLTQGVYFVIGTSLNVQNNDVLFTRKIVVE